VLQNAGWPQSVERFAQHVLLRSLRDAVPQRAASRQCAVLRREARQSSAMAQRSAAPLGRPARRNAEPAQPFAVQQPDAVLVRQSAAPPSGAERPLDAARRLRAASPAHRPAAVRPRLE
jgi:hypothetical protein